MSYYSHFSFISGLTSWVHQGGYGEYISRVSPLWQKKMSVVRLILSSSPYIRSALGRWPFVLLFYKPKTTMTILAPWTGATLCNCPTWNMIFHNGVCPMYLCRQENCIGVTRLRHLQLCSNSCAQPIYSWCLENCLMICAWDSNCCVLCNSSTWINTSVVCHPLPAKWSLLVNFILVVTMQEKQLHWTQICIASRGNYVLSSCAPLLQLQSWQGLTLILRTPLPKMCIFCFPEKNRLLFNPYSGRSFLCLQK